MNRIDKAREFCFASDAPTHDLPHEDAHKLMADYAESAVRERELEIVAGFDEAVRGYTHNPEMAAHAAKRYIDRLRSETK